MKTKVIYRLLIVLVILTTSLRCSNKNLDLSSRQSIISKNNGSPKTEANNSQHDYTVSVRHLCPTAKKEHIIQLSETNIFLEPVSNNSANASIVFRKDVNQAELFLPDKESIILTRTKNTKDSIWKKNDWEFIITNGYTLKRNGITVYQAINS